MKHTNIAIILSLLAIEVLVASHVYGENSFLPGERVLFEAHNCYPYHGLWRNRIDVALAASFPLGIELDLMWHEGEENDAGRLVVAHNGPLTDQEPTLEAYFFERVRSYVEQALASGDTTDWPLITLNINDIRSNRPEPFEEIQRLTETYKDWLCTATKGAAPDPPAPLTVRPVLVLSNSRNLAIQHFYDAVPEGGALRVFGSGSADRDADNFRRWINYGWGAVEPEGQRYATAWNTEKEERLHALVQNAHDRGYWIRFFSLNGHGPIAGLRLGLNPFYNFGSLDAAQIRWGAACEAGVDFIATDQIAQAQQFERAAELRD